MLASKLPLFIVVVVGLSLLLLAVVFRSLVIPIKAAVMNVLSIGAALGVITFVFQDGHLASLIGVREHRADRGVPTGLHVRDRVRAVDGLRGIPRHAACTRYGRRATTPARAVRNGLALTGKVVMAAAIIMVSVFGSFMLGDDRTIKLFGLGLASAVFVDAFIIRLILVPALMFTFGKWSWWMPAGSRSGCPRCRSKARPQPAPTPA